MATAANSGDRPLRLTPQQTERALRVSAERAMRIANAFGVTVPGKETAQLLFLKASQEPNSGMIDPIMGSETHRTLSDALFPRVRQRVLALLYGNPDRSFFSNEVVSLAQSGTGAVQRELASLAEAGLLTVTPQGNQRHYKANREAPVFEELRGLVLKTSGLVDVVRASLAPLAAQIDAAFVYGSVAKQEDTAQSDIDVMIISDTLGYADVFGALEAATATLGRKVNPTLYTPVELAKRLKQNNAFVTRVLKQPKMWLIGSQENLHV